MSSKKRKKGKRTEARYYKGIGLGILSGAGVMGVILSVGAVLIVSGMIPEHWMKGLALSACGMGAAVGGRISMKGQGGGNMLQGMLCGGVLVLMMMGCGMTFYGGLDLTCCGVVTAACLSGGGLAGVMGRGVPKHRSNM